MRAELALNKLVQQVDVKDTYRVRTDLQVSAEKWSERINQLSIMFVVRKASIRAQSGIDSRPIFKNQKLLFRESAL